MAREFVLQRRALKREACEILGIDRTKVRLRRLSPSERGMRGLYGVADARTKTIRTRGRTGLITYVHEILHLLYRRKSHMWIFGAAYILAGCPQRALPINLIAAAKVRQSKAKLQRKVRARARKIGLAPDKDIVEPVARVVRLKEKLA